MKVKELRKAIAQCSDDAEVVIEDIYGSCIGITHAEAGGCNRLYLESVEEFPQDWFDAEGIETNYNRDMAEYNSLHDQLALCLPCALYNEENPLECDIVVYDAPESRQHIIGAFQYDDGTIWFNVKGEKEPVNDDEFLLHELRDVLDQLSE